MGSARLDLTEWEVDVTGFSGAAFLDKPWRALADRLAEERDLTLVGDVTVTIGCRAFSTHREPLRFRFTTTSTKGRRAAEGVVRFELERSPA